MIKLLFYYEISHFADGMSNNMSYGLIKGHLLDFFGRELLRHGNFDVKSIVSESAVEVNKTQHGLDILNPIPINNEDYLAIAPRGTTFRQLYQKFFFSELSADEELRFTSLIHAKLGDWEPDLIIAFPIHNDYLKRIYPNALFLSTENGMLSRDPFPRTIRFEPFHYIHNFTNHYKNEISTLKLPPEEETLVRSFRNSVVELVEAHNPFFKQLRALKGKYRKLVLLPVIWGQNIYRESYDNDEVAFLVNTLRKLPADIGVIATFHDGPGSLLNSGVIQNIKRNHPNLITESDLGKRTSSSSPSLYFFNHVDAVLNCMTGTGLQACLWPTRIIAIDKHYSHWFADSIGLDNLEQKLSAPIRERHPLIYWYLTHCVVWAMHFTNGNWLNNYFDTLLKNHNKQNVSFDFFSKFYDFKNLAAYTLQYMRNSYKRAKIFDTIPAPLMRIASSVKANILKLSRQ